MSIHVGFWRPAKEKTDQRRHYSIYDDWLLPWPEPSTEQWDKESFIKAFNNLAEESIQYHGFSHCRLCDKINGTKDLIVGRYCVPEGYLHYVEVHNIKPPQDFIDYVMVNANFDRDWSR